MTKYFNGIRYIEKGSFNKKYYLVVNGLQLTFCSERKVKEYINRNF